MLVVAFVGGLGLLALPALARRGGRGLPPAEWARLCLAAVTVGAAVVELSVVLYAAPTLAHASRVPSLAALCERMFAPLAPGGPTAGWTAAAVAVMLLILGVVGLRRARRAVIHARIEPGLGRHGHYGRHRLVVLPTPQLVAVSVPGQPAGGTGQIVVSDGLLDALDAAELEAVLRHEAAHLRHNHHRFLLAAAFVDHAFAWFPAAGRSADTLRLALERWADEEAAVTCGDRVAVRDALVAVATRLVVAPSVAAFSAVETIGERLDALERDAPEPAFLPRILLYCPGTALSAVMFVALSSWADAAGSVLAMAGQCA